MSADDRDRAFEQRVVAALKAEGLIRREPARRTLAAVLAAALVAVLLAGALLMMQPRIVPPADEGSLYMLALYSGPGYRSPEPGDRSRTAEYAAWAQAHRRGRAAVVGGEELAPPIAVLGAAAEGTGTLEGYFLVRAGSRAEAVELARSVPHLRYGGTVVVRETVP